MLQSPIFYLVVGTTIVVVLALYAYSLLKRLKLQVDNQKEKALKLELAHKHHDKKVIDSVVIIVRAMKEEQCDFSEGCWRLSVLLDSLKLSENLNEQFPAIFKLYQAIQHMPILEARKKLEKQERMKLDYQRMKIESELTADIHKDIDLLHQYCTERLSFLTQTA